MADKSTCPKNKETYLLPFRQALKEARKEGSTAGISEALSRLGVALFEVEEFEQGAESLDMSISLARKLGDKAMAARHIGTKGLSLAEAKNPEPAAQCFQRVIDMAGELGDLGLECDALGNIGLVFVDTGDAGLALSNLIEAVSIAEKLGDQRREMIHVGNLGHAHLLLADIENALICFEKALEISRELGDRRSEAGYLTNLGTLAVRLDDQKEIIDTFEKVRIITAELGDIVGEMNALNQLIKAHTALDNKELALSYTQAARKLAARQEEMGGNPYDKTLVAQLFSLNREEEAFAQLQEAIETAHGQSDDLRELELLVNQGSAYFERGKLGQARQAWEMSLELAQKLQKPYAQARIFGYLATAQAELGDLEKSKALSHESLALAEMVEDRRIVAEQQISLALTHRDLGQPEKALDYCQSAVDSFAEIGLVEFEEKSRQLLQELRSDG